MVVMSNLFNFIGKASGKFFNVLNVDTELYCLECQSFTKHKAISWADLYRAKNPEVNDTFTSVFWGATDVLPSWNLQEGNPYACMKCRLIRHEGGVNAKRNSHECFKRKYRYKG